MNRRIASALLGVALACSVFTPAWADNDGDDSTEDVPRVVPYDGVLNLDGVGITGTIDVVFTLYDAADGGVAVWTEAWTTVEGRPVAARAGRFSVNLGTYEDISGVIADAGQVFLGIQVKQPEAENFASLGGRQRLNPVPYALWSAQASNLTVAGALSVGGNTTIGGNASVTGNLTVAGSSTSGGDAAAPRFLLSNGNNQYGVALRLSDDYLDLGVGNATVLPNGVRVPNNLRVNGSTYLGGNVQLGSQLNVGSSTTLQGNVQANNNLQVNGSINTNGTLAAAATTVRGTLAVSHDIAFTDCRICLNVRRVQGNGVVDQQKVTCTRLASGAFGGWLEYGDDIDADNQIGLSVSCNGGASGLASGRNVGTDDDIQNGGL